MATPKQINVTVREARGLPDMDNSLFNKKDKSDAFVEVQVGKKKFKTRTVKDDLNPKWNETFTFPVGTADEILFRVFDDDMTKDDYIGSASLAISRLYLDRPSEHRLRVVDKRGKANGELFVVVEDAAGHSYTTPIRRAGEYYTDDRHMDRHQESRPRYREYPIHSEYYRDPLYREPIVRDRYEPIHRYEPGYRHGIESRYVEPGYRYAEPGYRYVEPGLRYGDSLRYERDSRLYEPSYRYTDPLYPEERVRTIYPEDRLGYRSVLSADPIRRYEPLDYGLPSSRVVYDDLELGRGSRRIYSDYSLPTYRRGGYETLDDGLLEGRRYYGERRILP